MKRMVCMVVFTALATAGMAGAQGTADVNFGSPAQTIEGFGGSTAWMPELTSAQANALFSNGDNQQMGLSLLRVRIDPGGSANWGTELANAQEASARGASIFATPWTPPASMKSNDSTIGGTLNTSEYAAYATYLESFVTFMKNGGISLYAISMQNEPDASVTYESCSWTGATMDTWVKNNSSVITTKLIMPESESFNTGYSDPALDDSSAVGHIGIVAGHLYGTSPSYYTNAFSKGKQVWMTEHYLTGSGISGAVALAKEINDSMSIANYSAYLWWYIADWPAESYTYGLVDTNGNPTPNGYAMGQYAKFVRPGYVRANSTYNPSGSVYVTAYSGSGHYVIVAVNTGSSSVNQPFSMSGATVTTLTPYQTDSSHSMDQLTTVNVSNDTFTYTLPAQSITTFVH